MKTEQQLPKNIRQIGSPAGHTKVYIEDYVITFLNSLSMDKNTYVRGAILFGEKKQIGNDLVIFIRGAIEGQNLELDLDEQYLMMKYGERYINRRSDCFLVWMSSDGHF